LDKYEEAIRMAEEILLSNNQEAIEAIKAAVESIENK